MSAPSTNQRIKGTVRNVNDFGVFLDVGGTSEAFLPWRSVDGPGPLAGQVLDLIVRSVDIKGRLTVTTPQALQAVRSGKEEEQLVASGGFVYDSVQGARARVKGGKGDGRGAYNYPEGVPLSEFKPGDHVSGHLTNMEREGCWLDIGARKDGYLPWACVPGSTFKWRVGDLIDDLKIARVDAADISLDWDGENINALTDKRWEELFLSGIGGEGSAGSKSSELGENCCALLGLRCGGLGRQQLSAGEGKGRPMRQTGDAGNAKGMGGRGPGKGPGKGHDSRVSSDFAVETSSQPRGRKGWGKGEGPAAEALGSAAGSCCRAPEARGASLPPPKRRPRPIEDVSVGDLVSGRVVQLLPAGACVDFGCEVEGLVPGEQLVEGCRKGMFLRGLKVQGLDSSGRVLLEPGS